jgi:hypothetical protein
MLVFRTRSHTKNCEPDRRRSSPLVPAHQARRCVGRQCTWSLPRVNSIFRAQLSLLLQNQTVTLFAQRIKQDLAASYIFIRRHGSRYVRSTIYADSKTLPFVKLTYPNWLEPDRESGCLIQYQTSQRCEQQFHPLLFTVPVKLLRSTSVSSTSSMAQQGYT